MKYILSLSLLLSACVPFIGGSSCNKELDQQRVQEAISNMESSVIRNGSNSEWVTVNRVSVRYNKTRQIAIVTGYDRNGRIVRVENLQQSCKL